MLIRLLGIFWTNVILVWKTRLICFATLVVWIRHHRMIWVVRLHLLLHEVCRMMLIERRIPIIEVGINARRSWVSIGLRAR